ncbi:metallopeptidase TldD-related protein, partial [Neisseria sicca]|uniref:metallopeptidase TldD-related protein n=1 Tax=Neisseria sicca TaxID=490 RepID=UPI0034D9650C
MPHAILQPYFLTTYTPTKLPIQTTRNPGRPHNLYFNHTHQTHSHLLKQIATAFFLTQLIPHALNTITPHYSRGAA